jgi:hypothetical protein
MACPPRRFVFIYKTADDASRIHVSRQFSLIPTGEVPLNRLREEAVAVHALKRSASHRPMLSLRDSRLCSIRENQTAKAGREFSRKSSK